jgi:hypothetical protein
MARLYLTTAAAKKWRRNYRTKTDLMVEMLERVHRRLGEQKLHFLGDSAYTAPAVMGRFPKEIEVTGRVRLDSRLYAAPPPRDPHRRGQPAKRGKPLPKPEQMLQARARRLKVQVRQNSSYHIRLAETVARFFQTPRRPVRVVAVEHLRGSWGREAFYSTQYEAKAEQILHWFARRWSIEATFQEAKQHLGLQQPQSRKPKAVERTAPTGLFLYSLIVLWHECVRDQAARPVRHWRGKQTPSFADMLAALRTECLEQTRTNISQPHLHPDSQKILNILQRLLALAA